MIKLIKKDWYISKTYLSWLLLLPILIIFFLIAGSQSQALFNLAFAFNVLFLSCITLNSFCGLDVKNNTKLLIASLPIDREKDIKSKYFVSALFPVIYSILVFLFILYIEITRGAVSWVALGNSILGSYEIILLASSISIIYIGFTMPLYYCDSKVIKVLGIIPSILIIFMSLLLPPFLLNFEKYINISYIFESNLARSSLIAFIISIPIYLVSMKLTIKLYNKKEF